MKRILSMFLALCMVVTLLPVTAMAEEIHTTTGAKEEIIAFEPLQETEKFFEVGTALEDLDLPETLTATVRRTFDMDINADTNQQTVTEKVYEDSLVDIEVLWIFQPEYDMDTEGEYVFTPVIEGYTVSTELPKVTVTLEAAVLSGMMFGPMDATTYNVWVGGVQVTDDNKDDVLGAMDGAGATVRYDPTNKTLTLNSATINTYYVGAKDGGRDPYYGIYAKDSLNIVLWNDNVVTGFSGGNELTSSGIYTTGALTISGVGSLNVSGGTGAVSLGIWSDGELQILSGNITASSAAAIFSTFAIYGSKITISAGRVSAVADPTSTVSTGMKGGTIHIKGGTVRAEGKKGLNANTSPINISGGVVTAIGHGSGAFDRAISGALTVTDGTVTAQSNAKALDGSLNYSDCIVTAGLNNNGTDAGEYVAENLATYKYLHIEPVPADTTAPTVNSVSVPANGTYSAGQNLDFTVNFDENVTVTGTPHISLTVGSQGKQAAYVSGSGTPSLVFRYTVLAGDSDSDGVSIGSLTLNGGTIQDAAENNATLTLNSVGSTANILVDTSTAPSITSQPSYQEVNQGQSTTFSVAANGTGLTYQWQVNAGLGFTNILDGTLYSGATTTTLMITGVTAGMNGYQYRAIVSGTVTPAATSNSATLMVNAAPTYTITANPTSKNFGSLTVGYSDPAAQTVTIRNTGNSSVTLTQPSSTNYTIGTLSDTTLAANGTATFTITPKAGLAVGNYDETLTVSTDQSTHATVELSFAVTAAPNYTVTFNPNGGTVSETSRSVASGMAVGALPTPTRSGSYSFDGWYTAASGGTQISASTTINANVTYYAHWTYTGGGGSGSGGGSSSNDNSSPVIVTPPTPDKPNSPTQGEIKVPGTVDSNGNVTVSITDKTVTDAFDKALTDAKKNGTEQNGITVVLRVDTGSKTVSNVTVNLPKTVQDTIIAKKIVNTIVVVDNPDIRIGMDLASVQAINNQARADVNLTATRMNNSALTGDAASAIGARPVFDLKVNYGSNQVQNFGAGSVSVTIPYTLGANETPGNIQAVYVDANGRMQWLVNSVYDSLNGVLRFSTNHFSTYGVGNKQGAPVFSDVSTHWAADDIAFVANRGLLSGTSKTTFSPNTAMTRGMFVTALGRLANANVSGYTKSSFNDVKRDAYYMGYIEWANKNNIVNGVGNGRFAPDQSITREQMAVIMGNYAKAIGFALPKARAEITFADNAKISAYAKEAVKQMQMAGVISGKNSNLFDPQGAATRAEVSAVLRRFVELAISSNTAQGWTMNDSGRWMFFKDGKPLTGKQNISGSAYTFDQYGVTADVPKNLRYTTYTVKKGDSFWLIAHKLGCTMSELERLNNKSRFSVIHPGDVLRVPEK